MRCGRMTPRLPGRSEEKTNGMCGICGIADANSSPAIREERVKKMNAAQARRGPDDEGVETVGLVTLGHRRLSIIDLSSAGHQPFRFEGKKGSYTLSFNGEIYNFEALKKELEKREYSFKTKTDTEVICALYDAHGVEGFKKMRGIFAFALWDEAKERAVLVRDHFGVKPLYYYQSGSMLAFASSVRALASSGVFRPEGNNDAKIGFLLFGSVQEPHTTVKNVLSLPAGYVGIWDGKLLELKPYFSPVESFLNSARPHINFNDAVAEVRKRMEEAVRLNLVSDAPLGIFLSGGLDSSVLAALAARERTVPVTTLSISFDESEYNEKAFQDLVAKRIKSDHREVRLRKQDFFDSFDSIFDAMDQPTVDGINTYFVSKAAHDAGLKVVLSGLGSDEMFMGYSHFKRASFVSNLWKLPKSVRVLFLSAARLGGVQYRKLEFLKERGWIGQYGIFRGLFSPDEAAHLAGCSTAAVSDYIRRASEELETSTGGHLGELESEQALSYLELVLYMRNQLLRDTDVMSMRHSIEARVPFLDTELVRYVTSLSPKLKLQGDFNKQLLTEAVRDLIPREVFERKKMGFTFPFAEWLKSAPDGLLGDGPGTKSLSSRFKKGQLHWSRAWAGIVMEKYFKHN